MHFHHGLTLLCLVAVFGACDRAPMSSTRNDPVIQPQEPVPPKNDSPPAPASLAASPFRSAASSQTVYAAWYPVPKDSLAHRRAGPDELTAAHNRLPLGSLVRVTNLSNHKSVVVRITDRGVTSRRAKIDLCREAAQQLEMLRVGIARVRLEVLAKTAPSDSEAGTAMAH